MNLIKKLFAIGSMVKPDRLQGELPTSKEAYSNLMRIAIPSMIEMVFVSLIGSVDIMMVGRLGYEAVAAVGLSDQPRMIMLSMFLALNIGVTAIVARRMGEERQDDANLTLRNALVLVSIFSVIVMMFALMFARPFMLFAGAQSDTVTMSTDYFRILMYFLPINALTMCINAAQRGVGNTRIPMVANITANVVNVVCNYLLIYGNFGFPKLGVSGAAWSSGIGICIGCAMSGYSLFTGKGNGFLHISWREDWCLRVDTVKSILSIGGNAVIEQIAQRIGFFVYAIVIAKLGTAAFAAHQVALQFLSFSFNFGNGLAVAGTSLVGQMLGKKRVDLAFLYGKCAQRMALVLSILLATTIVLFRSPLVGIFLEKSDPANLLSIGFAVNLMFIVALFQPMQTSAVVISGCLRGAGDNLYVAMVMIICVAFVRPVFSIVAVALGLGIYGAWCAALIDMSLRLGLVYRRFLGNQWHNKKV